MRTEFSIKSILIFLVVCLFSINTVFVILIIKDKIQGNNTTLLSEEERQRNIIDYLKKNIDFNNTYEIKNNKLHFYYSTLNPNNPPN